MPRVSETKRRERNKQLGRTPSHGPTQGTYTRKFEELIKVVLQMREREPTVKYATIAKTLRAEPYRLSQHSAEAVIHEADEVMREEFQRFCASAPRVLYDGYMSIHAEAMREHNWAVAKSCLDSVRDMFGMRAAIQVNVTSRDVAPTAFDPLTDEQLNLLAMLDVPASSRMLDAESVEDQLERATVGADALEHDTMPSMGDDE